MPRTQESFLKLKEARRQEILKTALRLFALNGYDATSVNDIADDIGCSHGLVYHYFGDKKDIFTTLLDRSLELGYMPIFPNLGPTELDNPKETLSKVIERIFTELNDKKSDFAYYFYLFLNMRFQKRAPAPRFQTSQSDQRPFVIIKGLIETGQTKGDFDKTDPRDQAIAFFSLMRGLTYVKLHDGKFKLPSVDTIMNLFLRKADEHA